MKIVVDDIKKSINNLSNYIDIYENNYLNMNNLFSEIKGYWIGENSILFFNKTDYEQKNIYNNINEIKELLNVYKYIANVYSNFGNEIVSNVEKEEYLATYFNVYLSLIDQIVILYSSIPANYSYLIEDQKSYFINLKRKIINIKNSVKSSCNQISRVEEIIENKVSKIKIDVLKESDITSLLWGVYEKRYRYW